MQECKLCYEQLPSQAKEPMMSMQPSYPFEIVHVDLFSYAGYEYLIAVDKLSRWPMLARTGRSTDSNKVIKYLRQWFSEIGIPRCLVSDGGPQFKSAAFRAWCKSWSIQNEYSSPYNPRSNGTAEAAVKTLKKLVSKTAQGGNLENDDFFKGLLELRNTPREDGLSPAQVIFGRAVRGVVPMINNAYSAEHYKKWMVIRSKNIEKTAESYNEHAKPLRVLNNGEKVLIQNPLSKRWKEEGIIRRKETGRPSYHVLLPNGKEIWRNRRFLRPV